MNRAVLYARYSTDLQSAASIADQHRALRDALPHLGLRETNVFSDAAISGASWSRPGLEAALVEIEAGRADVLVAEALDRISRDLEQVARIAKRIAFVGARIVTLSEGEIGALHIGLSGTMAQLYLEQLAEKTRRGLRGVAADGRIAAGRAFGYAPQEDRANPPRPGRVHLRFTDTGGALLVERARAAAGVIAVAIHGAEGETVLYAADAELHALIDAISAAVARAQ